MSSNVQFAYIDPPVVEFEDVEDLLATDDLFIEYFNEYLGLPNFPEPLCFNKETGGFEVVSDARRQLAQQIKGAIRSQKRTPKIYRTAKNHSFIDIPLIPIELPTGPEKVEIDTSFTVTTLNKEQGIHWVKAERLPAFLESDKYLQYRIAKILSQCRLTGDNGEFVTMKLDYTLRPHKNRKVIDDDSKVDPKIAMMKSMFISLGTTSVSQCESWFSTAQNSEKTEMTFTTINHPQSSTNRPSSAVPASLVGMLDVRHRPDSGIASPTKNSGFGASYLSSLSPRLSAFRGEYSEDLSPSKLFSVDLKPSTPRPSEPVCMTTGDIDHHSKHYTGAVYTCPKQETTDSESGLGDMVGERDDDIPTDRDSPIDELTSSSEKLRMMQAEPESVVVNSINELGGLYAGAIIKRSLAEVTGVDEKVVEEYAVILNLFPKKEQAHFTMEMLDHISIAMPTSRYDSPRDDVADSDVNKEIKQIEEKKEEESDVDSLLDSEDDYEEQDLFFRRHKCKTYDLSSLKGIEQFKKFLTNTRGEIYWNMWLDIDRSNLMTNQQEILLYLSHMRERYQRPGAPYELSSELKISLGLVEPSQWTLSKLQSIQMKIAEPLVMYWGPRFLLKQLLQINPEKYYLYHQQQLLLKMKEVVNPNPPTPSLLPLRPKSCRARLGARTLVVTDALQSSYSETDVNSLVTSPPVGMRRMYSNLPPRHTQSARSSSQTKMRQNPKDFLSSKTDISANPLDPLRVPPVRLRPQSAYSLSRPHSARSAEHGSPRSQATLRPQSLKVKISSRPTSGTSRPTSAISSRPKSAISSQPPSAASSRPSSAASLRLSSATSRPTSRHTPRPTPRPTSRPTSATSQKSGDSTESTFSEFLGGRRMEGLLQSLRHEKDSGCFFRKFVQKSGNKLWINALHFWNDVQEYHQHFYTKVIDPYMVEKMAHVIYSQYIVVGAQRDIGCPKAMSYGIYKCIKPPYEELFDPAEELALSFLYEAWMHNLQEDIQIYKKVELIDVKRHLETKSKQILHLLHRGLIKERIITPDDPMEGYEDPVYDESLQDRIPEEFRDYTLEKLVHNRIELEHFRKFLADNYASMDLMCWMDIEAWRRIPPTDEKKCDLKAKEIKLKYLNKKYFFGPNSPAGKDGQNKVMEAGGGWGKLLLDRPPNPVILEAQKYVRDRLVKKWLPLFLATEEFEARQHPTLNMEDVVDDVMVQRNRRSQAVWKLLESRWVSSSNEILTFRRALLNPVTVQQFRRYVSMQGELLENDVLFWLEVQKYKDLNHLHSDDTMIMQKINAIVNCFLDSNIPPPIQVDITHEMADKIIEKKYEKGPYLFREAQLTVFRVLFAHWVPFCKFRANLTDEKVMSTLDRMHQREKSRLRKEQEHYARRRNKIEERDLAKSLAEGGGEAVVYHDPFKMVDSDEEAPPMESESELDKLSWKYSNYIISLEQEDLLNKCDESTFSSISEQALAQEQNNNMADYNLPSPRIITTPPKKIFSSEDTQTKGRSSNINIELERPSTSEVRFEKPKEVNKEKTETTKTKTSEVIPDKKTRFEEPVSIVIPKSKSNTKHPGASMTLIDPNSGKIKLSRQMPPLVQKKD